ncbi:MAG: hypothetical protein ABJB66_12495 [Gemmatimonadaceae bacterium]
MSHDRRRFLRQVTAGGLSLAALPAALSASEPTHHEGSAFDPAEFALQQELIELSEPQQAPKVVFDVSWTQKLTGKYRAVFDTPSITDGGGVWRAGAWPGHYKEVLKAEPSDINTVIVIRHAGIPLIMNHEFWDRYNIGKDNKVSDPMTGKRTKRNPVLMTTAEDKLPASFEAFTLPKQMERGVIVLGCNAAFGGMVSLVAKKEKLKFPEAREKALTMMAPGVILQPNGIFGLTLAQQNGCVFISAS